MFWLSKSSNIKSKIGAWKPGKLELRVEKSCNTLTLCKVSTLPPQQEEEGKEHFKLSAHMAATLSQLMQLLVKPGRDQFGRLGPSYINMCFAFHTKAINSCLHHRLLFVLELVENRMCKSSQLHLLSQKCPETDKMMQVANYMKLEFTTLSPHQASWHLCSWSYAPSSRE